jgi:ferric-dicitrate binding protein FerR (iron transport regulator)
LDTADETPWLLLTRQFSNSASAEEEEALRSWISADPSRAEFVRALRAAWDVSAVTPDRYDSNAAWQRVRRRVESGAGTARIAHSHEISVVEDRSRGERRSAAWVIAAAATLVIGIGLSLALRGRIPGLLRGRPADSSAARAVSFNETTTGRGQRALLRLSDGTRVTLGVMSKLRYPDGSSRVANGGRRDVYLEGTAFFSVTHDSARPFVVHTVNAVTEDIGTEFMVTAYPETQATEVVVAEGSVSIGTPSSTPASRTVLSRGQLALMRGGRDTAQLPAVGAADLTAYGRWMQGELAFRDTPLRDALVELQRWYDVDLRIGDPSIATAPLTATFAAESLPEALSVISTVMRVRTVRRGHVVTLYGRGDGQ